MISIVLLSSCSEDDSYVDQVDQSGLPLVENTSIAVGEVVEIQNSSIDLSAFTYKITLGNEYIEVFEKGDAYHIKGIATGVSQITLNNNVGQTIIEIDVTLDGEYFVDTQGLRYKVYENTASVAGGGANYDVDLSLVDSALVIPVNIILDGVEYPVTYIEDCAFTYNTNASQGNNTFNELKFEEGSKIDSIGQKAFANCDKLSTVDLSNCNSLISIGEQAFFSCDMLSVMDFTNCTSLAIIGKRVFFWCI